MFKSKKFNAAEKHFDQEKKKWIKRIKELEDANFKLRKENLELMEIMKYVDIDYERMENKFKEIMKLKDMTEDDIKILIAHKKSLRSLDTLLSYSKVFYDTI